MDCISKKDAFYFFQIIVTSSNILIINSNILKLVYTYFYEKDTVDTNINIAFYDIQDIIKIEKYKEVYNI